jgi:hypothetical protein
VRGRAGWRSPHLYGKWVGESVVVLVRYSLIAGVDVPGVGGLDVCVGSVRLRALDLFSLSLLARVKADAGSHARREGLCLSVQTTFRSYLCQLLQLSTSSPMPRWLRSPLNPLGFSPPRSQRGHGDRCPSDSPLDGFSGRPPVLHPPSPRPTSHPLPHSALPIAILLSPASLTTASPSPAPAQPRAPRPSSAVPLS